MNTQEAEVEIKSELGDSWLRFAPPSARPATLFHYTSQEGLIGIIKHHLVWATNILYLNDSSELDYGLSIARMYLDAIANTCSNDVVKKFVRRAHEVLELEVLLSDKHFYAFCFCGESNLLSQWRAYADRGGGYAIGFDSRAVGDAVIKQSLSLFPMDYGPDPKSLADDTKALRRAGGNSELLADDIESLCRALRRCAEQFPSDEETLISVACELLKLELISFGRVFWLKHPGFREEKEWRILATYHASDLSQLHFRESHTSLATLVPYVKLNLSSPGGPNKLPICKIIHGPSAHPPLASRSLDWLLKTHGYADVTTSGSTIPVR